MNEQDSSFWEAFQQRGLSRRHLLRGAAGTVLGASLSSSKLAYAHDDDDDNEPAECVGPTTRSRAASRDSNPSEFSFTTTR